MDPAQSLIKKAPAADLAKNLKDMNTLVLKNNNDATEALAKKFQLPFEGVVEPGSGSGERLKGERPFLKCRYNRVGGAGSSSERYRSPWTNRLYPDKVLHTVEDDDLRAFEASVNEVWESYKNMYYGHTSVGSVFLQKSTEGGAFQGVFCVQKEDSAGSWDALHFVHVDQPGDKTCNYRVESTILMTIKSLEDEAPMTLDVGAQLFKETAKSLKISPNNVNSSHVENIGTLIEGNEIDLRSNLERVQMPKVQESMDEMLKLQPKRPVMQNPVMGIMMNSDMLKKRLAKSG